MRLKEFFSGVAAKVLRPVEADPKTSNQHEFNGVSRFRDILGEHGRKFSSVFLFLDDEDEPVRCAGTTTWYDSRKDQAHRAAEYRLYFPSNEVSAKYSPGDLLVVARRPDDSLLLIAAPPNSTVGDQILWLFGLDRPNGKAIVRAADEIDRDVDYVISLVLNAIGVEQPSTEADSEMVFRRFGGELPSTREFSEFAREKTDVADPTSDPDAALLAWLETEERFFRAFERRLVDERLRSGFVAADGAVDVDGFVQFSLSVHNRRKSRAGYSLENHLEKLFRLVGLRFDRGATTEGRSKPDFLFPGRQEYLDPQFDAAMLAMLGAKATCKDRWRQILAEAARIETKHLVTLEPSITSSQTDQMKAQSVQLVLPSGIHATFSEGQQGWIWSIADFIEHVRLLQQG